MPKNFIPRDLYKKIVSLIPICCVDLVIKMKNSFLLVKRKENPAKNKWWFPGGRVLFGESLIEAVKRKIKEELNIRKFKNIKFLGIEELKFQKGRFNKPVHSIANVFLIELNKKNCFNIQPDQTIFKYKWFNSIQKNFHPYIKKFLKLAKFD